METSKLILVSITLVWCLAVVVQGFTYDDKEVDTEEGKSAMFERWRSHHKMEEISDSEKKNQYNTFKSTLEHVHKTNKANKPFKLELNRFAGMSREELLSKHTGLKIPQMKASVGPFRYGNVTDIPPAIDWRTKGAVTPVKSQGGCRSCYAFSAVGAVEGMHFIKTKELIQLSTKEIVDCTTDNVNNLGCYGGWMTVAFEYMEKNGGVTTEKNYPYEPKVEPCNVKKEHDIAVQVGGHENVPYDEESLMKAVAHQPVAISTDISDDFVAYKEGVLTSYCKSTYPVHAMLLVGYDTTPDGTKYWIVKNSWGDTWGDKGYIKMLRGVPEKEGYCHITTLASYPTFDKTSTPHRNNEPMVHTNSRKTIPVSLLIGYKFR